MKILIKTMIYTMKTELLGNMGKVTSKLIMS